MLSNGQKDGRGPVSSKPIAARTDRARAAGEGPVLSQMSASSSDLLASAGRGPVSSKPLATSTSYDDLRYMAEPGHCKADIAVYVSARLTLSTPR